MGMDLTHSPTHTTPHPHPPEKNGHHFADDIFKCNFMNEKFRILIRISLNFVSNGLIDNMSALV